MPKIVRPKTPCPICKSMMSCPENYKPNAADWCGDCRNAVVAFINEAYDGGWDDGVAARAFRATITRNPELAEIIGSVR